MPTVRVTHNSDIAEYFREKGFTIKNSLPGLMRQAGRLVAVSLAYQTQPFGFAPSAEASGKVAVVRDIYKVYTTPGKAFADISNAGLRKGFWQAVNRRDWDKAREFLGKGGKAFKFTPIDHWDDGAAHKRLRNNRGRIAGAQKPVMIVQDPTRIAQYVAIETGKVGYGKGGWATCARILGGIRGIPRWITKHDSPGSAIENYGVDRTTITLINQVPYASEILSESQKAEAINIATDKLFRSIRIATQRTDTDIQEVNQAILSGTV